jgi:raffinose/stachyose/melibiose transport system substrate-binding protein
MSDSQEPDPGVAGASYPRREFLGRTGKVVAATALAGSFAGAAQAKLGSGSRAAAGELDVWYLTTSPSELRYVTKLTQRFGGGQKLTRTSVTPYDFTPMKRSLQLALSAGSGPDVAYSSPGPDDSFVFQKNGWILDLNPYAQKYRWLNRMPPAIANYWNNLCCGGNIPRTGIPWDVVTVGFYYNPTIFARHGLRVPTTYDQLISVFQRLKANGVIPFAAGGLVLANPGALHYVFEQHVHALVPEATIKRWLLRDPSASFAIPGVVEALRLAQDWVRRGYLQPNVLATSGVDADALFVNGQAAMVLNGTWKTGTYLQSGSFKPGFFAFPRINQKIPWRMGGYSPNNQWMISAFARDKALAARYIDYMVGSRAAMSLWANSSIPAFRFKKPPKPTSQVQADVVAAMGKTEPGYYLATVGGVFQAQFRPTLAKLFSLSATPQEVAQELQENYTKSVRGG